MLDKNFPFHYLGNHNIMDSPTGLAYPTNDFWGSIFRISTPYKTALIPQPGPNQGSLSGKYVCYDVPAQNSVWVKVC